MTWLRQRWFPLVVLVAAMAALVGSIAVTESRENGFGPSHLGMMGVTARGDGPVDSLDAAQRAADRYGQRWGLHVGEVMQFDNGFYAELLDPSGGRATEVLIDPASGTVGLEYGPAMMWNTTYGMHRARSTSDAIDPARAQQIAQAWLDRHRPGEQAGEADAFPGYYTLHSLNDGKITGMLSVHAATGVVWYHIWHGQLIDMREATE
jgi:hypothetical protein